MRLASLILLMALLIAGFHGQRAAAEPGQSEPVLRLINFTADWCPNCRILNPLIEEAMAELPAGEIERVDLDMTDASRTATDFERISAVNEAIRLADSRQAGYLWDWYGGVTGIAVIISADNGEPISCINRTLNKKQIVARFERAKILSLRRAQGERMPEGPNCPAPMR